MGHRGVSAYNGVTPLDWAKSLVFLQILQPLLAGSAQRKTLDRGDRLERAHAQYRFLGAGNLRKQNALDAFETVSTAQRAEEPLPAGRLSVTHYQAIHHHLFQDVYVWVGKFRTVRIAKDGSAFCYPEHIGKEMADLFGDLREAHYLRGLSTKEFSDAAAHFLATLNAIHPFREGNGRTQTTFLALLADQAGHSLDLERLKPNTFLKAMVASFKGDERPLAAHIRKLVG